MDINICINRLGLNGNRYRLNQSNPPHYFIEWSGSDPQPTEAELQSAWDSYVAEQPATQYQRDRQASLYGKVWLKNAWHLSLRWKRIDRRLKQSIRNHDQSPCPDSRLDRRFFFVCTFATTDAR